MVVPQRILCLLSVADVGRIRRVEVCALRVLVPQGQSVCLRRASVFGNQAVGDIVYFLVRLEERLRHSRRIRLLVRCSLGQSPGLSLRLLLGDAQLLQFVAEGSILPRLLALHGLRLFRARLLFVPRLLDLQQLGRPRRFEQRDAVLVALLGGDVQAIFAVRRHEGLVRLGHEKLVRETLPEVKLAGKEERGFVFVVAAVDAGTVGHEQSHHVGVVVLHADVQRIVAVHAALFVDLCASGNQHSHRLDALVEDGNEQRSLVVRVLQADCGTLVEEVLYHSWTVVLQTRVVQRRAAVLIKKVKVLDTAFADHILDERGVAKLARVVETTRDVCGVRRLTQAHGWRFLYKSEETKANEVQIL
eukprot:Rhum_TRINITY_DN6048_c0_g1::Rhum_TRINITY_DN6048_c0_g1_i1::g.18951::m.18951